MSIRIMAQVWESSPFEGRALLVELALADFANDEGLCWPSIETLARKARCSESWVHQIIRQLKAAGRLYVAEAGGRGRTNIYKLDPYAGEKGALDTPFSDKGSSEWSQKGAVSGVKRVHSTAPRTVNDPSFEPPAAAAVLSARPNIFRLYEQLFGKGVSPLIAERLKGYEETHSQECIEHCFQEAAESNARNVKLVYAILDRHEAEGCYAERHHTPSATNTRGVGTIGLTPAEAAQLERLGVGQPREFVMD